VAQNASKHNGLKPDADADQGPEEFDPDEAPTGPWASEDPIVTMTNSPLRTSAPSGADDGGAPPPRDDQKAASKGDRRRDVAAGSKKTSPFQKQRERVQSSWLSKLSKFAPDAMWYAKRVGPPYYRGRKTKVGVYPKPFMGPVSPETIASQMGGGLISVTLDDPASEEAEWYGPIEIMWDDVSEKGIEPRDLDDGTASEAGSSRGQAQDNPNDEVTVFDPKLGMIKRRRADVERQFARSRDDAVIEEVRRAQAEQQELLRTLLERLTPLSEPTPREPQKSPMEELLRLERERLEADRAVKAEELRFLREKLEKDRLEAERQRKHELEIAERRFEAEKERLATERASLEERLDQERRLAEAKIEKAHTTMLEMVNQKTNPLEHVSTLLGTFHEVQELLGGASQAAPVEGGGSKRSKTVSELVVDKLVAAADRLFPSVEPILQHAVRSYLDRTVREVPASAPRAAVTGAAPPAALPAPAESPPEARAQEGSEPAPELDWGQAIRTTVADLEDGMNRNLPPRAVWENLRASVAPVAEQLRAYGSVDQLAAELETIAGAPPFAAHAEAIRGVARRAKGEKRVWAEQFLEVARGERTGGRVAVAPAASGGRA